MKIKLPLITLLLAFSFAATANNLRQISSREGISNNAILSLAQDKNGYIWVGSCDGLNMWDGERMHLYPNDWGSEVGLSGNLIEEIAQTSDSLFWIRTNHGLDLFDPITKSVERHNDFQGMYKIATRRSDQVVVLTQDNKLFFYNNAERKFALLGSIPHADYASVLDMLIDQRDTLWLFTLDGIFSTPIKFSDEGSSLNIGAQSQLPLDSQPLYAFVDGQKVLFVDKTHTLYQFDTQTKQVSYIKDLSEQAARMGELSSIIADGDDYMISFLTNGAIRLRMIPESSQRFCTEQINVSCGVFSLLRDSRQDIVWIGTDGQGLLQQTRSATAFRSITYNQMPYNLSKPVRALHLDSRGSLWVGTKGEGLLKIDNFNDAKSFNTQNVKQITTQNSELLDNSVYAFAASPRNIMWIGGDGEGLNYYSYQSEQIHTLKTPVAMRYIHAMHQSDDSTLWVATVGCGVFKVSLGGGNSPIAEKVTQLYFNEELRIKNFFFTLYHDQQAIWFGNRGGGAVRYQIESKEHRVVKFDNGRSAISNDIFAIHRSKDSTMWFATSDGLIRIGSDTTKVAGISNAVHGILEDKRSNLWLSTNRGLVKYTPRTGSVVRYGYSYGLNTIEYSDGAYCTDPLGETLLFGGINGVVAIDQMQYTDKSYNPAVIFREITTKDGVFSTDKFSDRRGVITLDYAQRNFSLTVSALDYIDGSNYTYSYRLMGSNDQWAATPSELKFANLPAGRYTLEVKYRNSISGQTSPVYSIEVCIKPAWYASTLAKFIYILLLVTTTGLIVLRYLRRYSRRRQEALERLEAHSKEEAYISKMRFFSNITQELSMPLTMISAPCQQILGYPRADQFVLRHAQTIRQNVSRLHDLIYMLHELREVSSNEERENIELVSVSEIAHKIVDSFDEYSTQNSLHCTLDVEQDLVWPTDKQGLTTILSTLLSNAFKHTPYNGQIKLTIKNNQGILTISTSNDSVGVNMEDIEAIFDKYRVLDYLERKSKKGLSFQGDLRLAICHSIAERMNGKIHVQSTPNAQTTFTVKLPHLKISEPSASTTEHIVPLDTGFELPLNPVAQTQFSFDKSRQTILVVNDGSEIMSFVAELFANEYNIRLPQGMGEVVDMLKQMHPDIVICNMLSQQSDSLSIVKMVKEGKLTAHIPVILLSTPQQVDERIKGVEFGADLCLTLPFNVEYLKAVVDQLLRRNRSLKDYYKSSISAFELSDGRMLHQDDKEFIDKMIKIINDNISSTDISTKFIADQMGVSVRNLYRRLDGILNQTPTSIIKEYRLVKAEQLLKSTKLSIDEIIYKAGFVNRGTFFKSFATKFGCTPKAYRKERFSELNEQFDSLTNEHDDI